MGVRPPSNDVDDTTDSVEFGIVALDARMEDWELSFPVTAEELDSTHGTLRIAVDPGGNKIPLSKALENCEQRSFDSKQDLLNALHPVFEEKREAFSGSIIGRLRSLVPF